MLGTRRYRHSSLHRRHPSVNQEGDELAIVPTPQQERIRSGEGRNGRCLAQLLLWLLRIREGEIWKGRWPRKKFAKAIPKEGTRSREGDEGSVSGEGK